MINKTKKHQRDPELLDTFLAGELASSCFAPFTPNSEWIDDWRCIEIYVSFNN